MIQLEALPSKGCRQPQLQSIAPFMAVTSETPATVRELCNMYYQWAVGYYIGLDGKPTRHHYEVRLGIRHLIQAAGDMRPADLSIHVILHIQRELAASGVLVRKSVNSRIATIKRLMKWAAQRSFVPPSLAAEVLLIENLRRGQAPDSPPVQPVTWKIVRQTVPHLGRIVGSMVLVQWHTGARSDEICSMRACDIDRSKPVWIYKPQHHKTMHKGKSRLIAIGPQAQVLLRPFIDSRPPSAFLFCPREAYIEHQAERARKRVTPLGCGNAPGTNRKADPKWKPLDRYQTPHYCNAVQRACDRAFPLPFRGTRLTDYERAENEKWRKAHRWHPHQLRHAAATRLRKECGIEVAKCVLGHSDLRVTEIYAERDMTIAAAAMAKYG